MSISTHLPQQDRRGNDVVVILGLAARLGKITVVNHVVQSVFEVRIDLRYQSRGIDGIQGHAHRDVDRRDEQGRDGCHAGGMSEARSRGATPDPHAGTILKPTPRTVSIRVLPDPTFPRRRAMWTSMVFEPKASASSAQTCTAKARRSTTAGALRMRISSIDNSVP